MSRKNSEIGMSAPSAGAGAPQNKKRETRRWSPVDTVIVLLAVLCVASLVYRVIYAYQHRSGGERREVICDVSFVIDDIHKTVFDCISPESALYVYESGERLGYIGVNQDDTSKPALIELPSDSQRRNRVSAEGHIVCVGSAFQNGCLLVDGTDLYLAPGIELTVCTDSELFTIRVVEVKPRQ